MTCHIPTPWKHVHVYSIRRTEKSDITVRLCRFASLQGSETWLPLPKQCKMSHASFPCKFSFPFPLLSSSSSQNVMTGAENAAELPPHYTQEQVPPSERFAASKSTHCTLYLFVVAPGLCVVIIISMHRNSPWYGSIINAFAFPARLRAMHAAATATFIISWSALIRLIILVWLARCKRRRIS